MEEFKLCDYGCGKEAKFQMTSGKWCCENFYTKCPSMKKRVGHPGSKNSMYGKFGLNHPKFGKIKKLKKEKSILCDYGCGQESKYYFKAVDKWCCSSHYRKCKVYRKNLKEKPELCDYGCGKEAKYYFKNVDKWGCSISHNKCLKNRNKNSEKNKGRKKPDHIIKMLKKFNEDRKNGIIIVSSETRAKLSLATTLEKNGNWRGGKSFENYPFEFNSKLKKMIKHRDNYKCVNLDCSGESKKLSIHHIDYNKNNCSEKNLVTLCNKCHAKTNGKREYNKYKYQKIIDGWYNEN